ncbi:MAG: hypothetical protein KIT33_06235 [Candidatus Kapabacteria bacterium]|nr:hypothetical protein [Ignavibacteriota bacterium]MCW5884555.1 hypothetical protein [Candidatus Kapabacteria bacterium]
MSVGIINDPGRNVIAWFEMPVRRIAEAAPFYTAVFGVTIDETTINGQKFGIVISNGPAQLNNGVLVECGDSYTPCNPCNDAAMHYFEVDNQPQLNAVLQNVAANGGVVISQPTVFHPLLGSKATFLDNQGNLIGIRATG